MRRLPDEDRFWARVSIPPDMLTGCWEWTGSKKEKGYGRYCSWRAHRAAWVLVRGPIPNGLHVLHRCDNRACVNPAHLFLGTNQENVDDRNAKGRQPRGETHGSARLTVTDVLLIRERAASGVRRKVIAQEFGVSLSQVGRIGSGRKWRHITPEGANKHGTHQD